MTLIRRVVRMMNLLEQQNLLIERQQHLIDKQDQELRRQKLEHLREMEGLVAAWRIHMETPEVDMRADVQELMVKIGHQAAQLEEHVV